MPNITAAGTYTAQTAGFEGLASTDKDKALLFAGSSIGTACTLQYIDDTGTPQTMEGGSVTTLPRSFNVKANQSMQLVVTGTPNFNLTIA